MASVKLCLLGLLVFAMLSGQGTWARKDSRIGKTIIVRESVINNVDVSKMEKMIEEIGGNSKNVMVREVSSDGATTYNLKCKNRFEKCTSTEECCFGTCFDLGEIPPQFVCV